MEAIRVSISNFLVRCIIDHELNEVVIMDINSEFKSRNFLGEEDGQKRWKEASEKFPVEELSSNEELSNIFDEVEEIENQFASDMANDHTPYYFEGKRIVFK
ncbi:MAG: hypothetical protein WC564_02385 [Patescibacteria group bacterium]|jgi:5'-deoxynucleotidase YfbR-like HD superfamily hydrolase